MRRGCFEAAWDLPHHHHPHRLGKKNKLSLSQELGSWGKAVGWEEKLGSGKKEWTRRCCCNI